MLNQASDPEPRRSDKFVLRLHDAGLRRHLKVRAAQHERTLNAEIIYLLKRGLAAEGDPLLKAEQQGVTR